LIHQRLRRFVNGAGSRESGRKSRWRLHLLGRETWHEGGASQVAHSFQVLPKVSRCPGAFRGRLHQHVRHGESLLWRTRRDPAPSVFLEKFGDNSIDFQLVVWSSEMSARPSRYRSDLNFAIEQKFREAGIELPFPQRDLHIRSGVLKVENIGEKESTKSPES
jgi:hypothetical protein